MATSTKMLRVCRQALGPWRFLGSSIYTRQLSSVTSDVIVSDDVKYPDIKPRYPPGAWGEMSEKKAWNLYNEAMDLNKIDEVKFRLEKMAGDLSDVKILYNVTPFAICPNALKYFQYITKTHIATGFPDQINEMDVSKYTEVIQPQIIEAILLEKFYQLKKNRPVQSNPHRIIGKIVESMLPTLSVDKDHILRSQVDESVRVETFWRRYGYGELESVPKGCSSGSLTFQFKHEADYQIRTELPLPEFVPRDHDICMKGEYPEQFNYGPYSFGIKHTHERPITVSGHWVGDPCNFTHTSLHAVNDVFYSVQDTFGSDSKIVAEKFVECGLLTAFGSCVAQAHNLGFNKHWDVTYPITTQTVVTDGKRFQMFAYQLNTLHLWRANESNPLRNILWKSPLLNLYDTCSKDEVKDFNSDVLSYLIKFLSNTPVERGYDLRPYLPNEEDPVNRDSYINDKGTEPPPPRKAERFLYPRNAVYF